MAILNMCTKQQCYKICEAKTDRTDREALKFPTVTVYISSSLSVTERKTKQNISQDREELNTPKNVPDQHVQNTPPTKSRMHILFKGLQNTHQNDHILGHKISLNKFKVIKIINSTFSDHNGIKLEISNRKLTGKPPNTGKLNRTLLNDP